MEFVVLQCMPERMRLIECILAACLKMYDQVILPKLSLSFSEQDLVLRRLMQVAFANLWIDLKISGGFGDIAITTYQK